MLFAGAFLMTRQRKIFYPWLCINLFENHSIIQMCYFLKSLYLKEIRFLFVTVESKALWNWRFPDSLSGQGLIGYDLVVNHFWAPVDPWSKPVKSMSSAAIYICVMKKYTCIYLFLWYFLVIWRATSNGSFIKIVFGLSALQSHKWLCKARHILVIWIYQWCYAVCIHCVRLFYLINVIKWF